MQSLEEMNCLVKRPSRVLYIKNNLPDNYTPDDFFSKLCYDGKYNFYIFAVSTEKFHLIDCIVVAGYMYQQLCR